MKTCRIIAIIFISFLAHGCNVVSKSGSEFVGTWSMIGAPMVATPTRISITANGNQYLVEYHLVDGRTQRLPATYRDGDLDLSGMMTQITYVKAVDHILLRQYRAEFSRVK
jgi:hypothetical protein